MGEGVVAGGELIAAGQQIDGVGVEVGVGDRRQVGGGVLEGGQRRALCGVGGAQVLSPGQVGGGDDGQGVGGAALGRRVGDEQQFGVGGCGVLGEPGQLGGRSVIGVVDDDQAARW